MFPAAIHCCDAVPRLPPGACVWHPCSHWPYGCWGHPLSLWRENETSTRECFWVREREGLCSLGLYYLGLGEDQEVFQNNQSTFQALVGLWWAHPSTIWSHSHVRPTGLYGCHFGPYCVSHRSTSPAPFDFGCACANLPLFCSIPAPSDLQGTDRWLSGEYVKLWLPGETIMSDSLCCLPLLISSNLQ